MELVANRLAAGLVAIPLVTFDIILFEETAALVQLEAANLADSFVEAAF